MQFTKRELLTKHVATVLTESDFKRLCELSISTGVKQSVILRECFLTYCKENN